MQKIVVTQRLGGNHSWAVHDAQGLPVVYAQRLPHEVPVWLSPPTPKNLQCMLHPQPVTVIHYMAISVTVAIKVDAAIKLLDHMEVHLTIMRQIERSEAIH